VTAQAPTWQDFGPADPWPSLWMGGEDAARRLASEELRTFWD
jgi:hypothetical protein